MFLIGYTLQQNCTWIKRQFKEKIRGQFTLVVFEVVMSRTTWYDNLKSVRIDIREEKREKNTVPDGKNAIPGK